MGGDALPGGGVAGDYGSGCKSRAVAPLWTVSKFQSAIPLLPSGRRRKSSQPWARRREAGARWVL